MKFFTWYLTPIVVSFVSKWILLLVGSSVDDFISDDWFYMWQMVKIFRSNQFNVNDFEEISTRIPELAELFLDESSGGK